MLVLNYSLVELKIIFLLLFHSYISNDHSEMLNMKTVFCHVDTYYINDVFLIVFILCLLSLLHLFLVYMLKKFPSLACSS